MTYFAITAFVAPHDCQAVAVGLTPSEVLDKWQAWLTQGEPLENLSDSAVSWIVKARSDLRNLGLTEKQDSGCHYRLEICY